MTVVGPHGQTEAGYAETLAAKVLESRVNADPDDDLAVLARQFLIARERSTATRQLIQRWRNDAFEAAAQIVEKYFGKDADHCAQDIRALKREDKA